MAISRNACSLHDLPEFAQAVRYGAPELMSPELSQGNPGGTFMVRDEGG